MTHDRMERILEQFRGDLVAVREAIAGLSAQLEMWKLSEGRMQRKVDQIEQAVKGHAESDASTHAQLQADVRRLWWGVGIMLTTSLGALAAYVLGLAP